MTGKVCLVTGASSGIGFETAKTFTQMGARVVTVSRGQGNGAEQAERIRQAVPQADVHFMPADLSSQGDIRRLAADFKQKYDRLDVLVNNAGLFVQERKTTPEGYELTFALNHLAYFLLTDLLLTRLQASAPARIVNVASGAERMGKIHFGDPMLTQGYSGWKAYGQSKLANLMFTFELARRLQGSGITVNALHPGAVATGFGQDGSGLMNWVFKAARPFFRSPEKGAETVIYLATSPEIAGTTGGYFKDKKRLEPSERAQDAEAQAKLWRLSETLVRPATQVTGTHRS